MGPRIGMAFTPPESEKNQYINVDIADKIKVGKSTNYQTNKLKLTLIKGGYDGSS